jgi:hypothetical protein
LVALSEKKEPKKWRARKKVRRGAKSGCGLGNEKVTIRKTDRDQTQPLSFSKKKEEKKKKVKQGWLSPMATTLNGDWKKIFRNYPTASQI